MVKIDFEITSEDGLHTYRDALYLEDDNTLSEEEIQKMKQDRFDKWITIITTPPENIVSDPTVIVTP